MRKHSLVGTWLGFTGQAECIRPVVTNGLHCHPGSIVPIVTQNQTHTRGRRLIGCTLERFHPPLHMTEYWNSRPLVFATQSTVPTHIQGFDDKRAVNIWRFGKERICRTVAGYLSGPREFFVWECVCCLCKACFRREFNVGMVCSRRLGGCVCLSFSMLCTHVHVYTCVHLKFSPWWFLSYMAAKCLYFRVISIFLSTVHNICENSCVCMFVFNNTLLPFQSWPTSHLHTYTRTHTFPSLL